jgi:ABC-type branched-subunit amino acid transport system substrate-binding protein
MSYSSKKARKILINQDEFDKIFSSLPPTRKKVLKLFLRGHTDCKIAEILGFIDKFSDGKKDKTSYVRKHILLIREDFGLTKQDDCSRENLVRLFYFYKRDWVEPYVLIEPGFNFYLTIGTNYFDREQYPEAIALFKNAIDGDRTDPIAQIYFNNAVARLQSKETSKPSYKIAVVVAYSGNEFHVDASKHVLRGIADAQAQFNKNNGKDGRWLEIVIVNDKNQSGVAKEVAEYLSHDSDILAVIGHHASEGTQAALSVYEENLIAIVSPTSTSSKLHSSNFFRTIGSTTAIASKYVSYIKDYLHLDRVAIFYHQDNEYSQTLTDDFIKAFEHRGGKIELIMDMGNPHLNLDEAIKDIKMDCKVEIALVLPSIETNCVAIAIANKNAKQPQSQKLQLLFSTSLPETPTLEKGGAAVEGVVLVSPSLAKESKYIQYAKDRWQQPDVNWRVATAYDATQAIIKAIELSTVVTRAAILEKLEKIDLPVDRTSGCGLSWSKTDYHANAKIKYSVWQIHHGRRLPLICL